MNQPIVETTADSLPLSQEMETALIARARKGNHQAFLKLVARNDRALMSVIYRFTGNQFDREDLYQDIFLHCWKSIGKFKGNASFTTWLYRLAMNRCISYMRKNRDDTVTHDQDLPYSPNPEKRAKLQAVMRAAEKLNGAQRICFHLFFVENWKQDEIAEVLNCETGTVKSHLNRAKQKVMTSKEVTAWSTPTN